MTRLLTVLLVSLFASLLVCSVVTVAFMFAAWVMATSPVIVRCALAFAFVMVAGTIALAPLYPKDDE